jgi:lysine-N-methylase
MVTPRRPILLPHVFPRRHLTGTTRLVVLLDTEKNRSHPIAERSWRVLSAMDGSRDVDGIVRRVRLDGGRVEPDEVAAFVAELAEAGLVGEAPEQPSSTVEPMLRAPLPTPLPPEDPTRVLEQLPGFGLHCDGKGSCCRFYPTVAFTPLEAARARVHCPDVLDAGHVEPRAFLPIAGRDSSLLAVALTKGRCAYLEPSGACGVHRAAGASAKPLGCRTYPARFVDDGLSVRVSPWFECACVASSACRGAEPGVSLVPNEASTIAELPPGVHVEHLPELIAVAERHMATRAELSYWSRSLAAACPTELDGVAAYASLARALDKSGLDEAASLAALREPVAPTPDDVRAYLVALHLRADRLARDAFRDPDDLTLRSATALATACELAAGALDELLEPAPAYARVEAAHLRVALFGHHLAMGLGRQKTLAVACFDRSVRLLAARALGVVARLGELDDPAFAEPLALVEALSRGYGLSAYFADGAAARERAT